MMNKRRFVLFLIVGLLTFLIGVTAAIALGGFDPLERFSRHGSRHLTIPPQPLIAPDKVRKCDHTRYQYARPRTADMRYHDRSLTPPPRRMSTVEQNAPFEEESETPSTTRARR